MSEPTSYDRVPYQSNPFPLTHPDHLAAMARLFGLEPPPVERGRVLELGCAGGGNLIPMAVALPGSTFLGIDLSPRQVAEGARVVERLGLTNLELRAGSILDLAADLGTFDYILCHGVYSWVPAPVQEKILEVYARHLAPDGVGHVSYNTYPGWHLRGAVRDMMCYHAKAFATADDQVEQARALLDFLARSCRNENDPYSLLLAREADALGKQPDGYLYHEHLEDWNEPLYFHQFVARARRHGLGYLGDADIRVMTPGRLPAEVREVLRELAPDQIEAEQYLDFLRNRAFRQTLLCHRHQRPNYALDPGRLTGLLIAAHVKPPPDGVDLGSSAPETFTTARGLSWPVTEPVVKAALLHLGESWPAAVSLTDLTTAALARVQADPATLGEWLLATYVRDGQSGIELHTHRGRFVTAPGPRPVASPLARLQAAAGDVVTSLRHESVTLGEFERQLLLLLDGKHGAGELRNRLSDLVARGVLKAEQDGHPVRGTWEVRKLVTRVVDEQLARLACAALLIG